MFDNITSDDLVLAFFPCIKFCNIAEYNQRSMQLHMRRIGTPIKDIYAFLKKQSDERHYFYQLCLKMHCAIELRGLRMIMENPWHVDNYTNKFWFKHVDIIDKDRTRRGDYFRKPTGYWFTGCEPTHGFSQQQTPSDKIMVTGIGTWSQRPNKHSKEATAKGSSVSGLCSEERSMISPPTTPAASSRTSYSASPRRAECHNRAICSSAATSTTTQTRRTDNESVQGL